MNITSVSVIIPAYKPDEKLLHTLTGLTEAGFTDLLVVDDGSGAEFAPIFQKVEALPGCTLLRHPQNRGKGAALKTAMGYFLENRPEQVGAVTADADGQHLPVDIAAVSRAMLERGNIVLGVRDFSGAQVPTKSRLGNRITSGVFRLFFGMKLRDTQTGLRAFPRALLPALAAAPGDRYEYETQMLFLMSRKKFAFEEVEIATVYLEENRSSHFRAVRDSLRIYALIIRYLVSSCAAALVDELAFFLFKSMGLLFQSVSLLAFLPLTWSAAIAARLVSSLVNFFLNARLVFDGETNGKTLARYYALAVVQLAVSTALVFGAEQLLSIHAPVLSTLVKAAVDTVLFFFSFRIQHKWVFNQA